MTYSIKSIEKGLIGDDFVHNRITIKADLGDGEFEAFKLYPDGRIVGFTGGMVDEAPYKEHELDPETINEIKSHLE